ncbi:unnamed protein product, partial [Phaeothamnion confervicola]
MVVSGSHEPKNSIHAVLDASYFFNKFNQPPEQAVGIRTAYREGHAYREWEYLRHNVNGGHAGAGSSVNGGEVVTVRPKYIPIEKGLATTRFHKGFQRRPYRKILQDIDRRKHEELKDEARAASSEHRRRRLEALDKRNQFNIITGEHSEALLRATSPSRGVEALARRSENLSVLAAREEYVLLRDSLYRFHAPAWTGEGHDARQGTLRRQGLLAAASSSVLGVGRSEMQSFGVEDQFSKSLYDERNGCRFGGLPEACEPGCYTPRKLSAAASAARLARTNS